MRIFIFMVMILVLSTFVAAEHKMDVFYGETCPHCIKLHEFLDSIENTYDFKVNYYEVYKNADNRVLFEETLKKYGMRQSGVPTYIIDDAEIIVGFDENRKNQIISLLSSDVVTTSNQDTTMSTTTTLSQSKTHFEGFVVALIIIIVFIAIIFFVYKITGGKNGKRNKK